MRDINTIIIHCSATKNGLDFRAINIDAWHKERGWSRIGYHYVITVNGKIELGRPVDQIGAHVKNHNTDSIGICIVGTDKFREDQWYRLRGLVRQLQNTHNIRKIYGHKYFSHSKKCPGFNVIKHWLRRDMQPLKDNILT